MKKKIYDKSVMARKVKMEVYFYKVLILSGKSQHLKLDSDKLKIYTIKPKATTKITKVIFNKPTKKKMKS